MIIRFFIINTSITMDLCEIGKKWQKKREEAGTYKVVEDPEKQSFYILDMFPYPSGAGLHV